MYSSLSAISPIRSAGAACQGSPVGRRNPAVAWRRSVPPLKAQNEFVRSAIITLVSLSVIACVLELSGLVDRANAADASIRERGDAKGIWLLPSNTTVAVLMFFRFDERSSRCMSVFAKENLS